MITNINIGRDSVCMADDYESHDTVIEINQTTNLNQLILILFQIGYLPSIGGGKATWILMYKSNPLAVIAEEWRNQSI